MALLMSKKKKKATGNPGGAKAAKAQDIATSTATAAYKLKKTAAPKPKKETRPRTKEEDDSFEARMNAPEPVKPKGTPPPEDNPSDRARVKRSSDKQRLAQIGGADRAPLSPAESADMESIGRTGKIGPRLPAGGFTESSDKDIAQTEKDLNKGAQFEALSKERPLRPVSIPFSASEQTQAPRNVPNPGKTGLFSFNAPVVPVGGRNPGAASSLEKSPKVAKDLARRVGKGMGLPGDSSGLMDRALEIQAAAHSRMVDKEVENERLTNPSWNDPKVAKEHESALRLFHAKNAPSKYEAVTLHPMRQAVVEQAYGASEEHIRNYAAAKKMSFEDMTFGLHNSAQQSLGGTSRYKVGKNPSTNMPELSRAGSENAGDTDFIDYVKADMHAKSGPRPAIAAPIGRAKGRAASGKLVAEIDRASGHFGGHAVSTADPKRPPTFEEVDAYNASTDEKYNREIGKPTAITYKSKKVITPKGKKPKKDKYGPVDSMGGSIPSPTPESRKKSSVYASRMVTDLPVVPKSKISQPGTSLSQPYKDPEFGQQKSQQFWNMEQPTLPGFENDSATSSSLLGSPRKEAYKRRKTEAAARGTIDIKSSNSSRVVPSVMPKPEKYAEAIKTLPYSSGPPSAMDRPQFATSVTPGKVVSVPKDIPRTDSPGSGKANTERMGTGDSNQPFLKPSLSKKQLAERFPDDFTTSKTGESLPKPGKQWNPTSRQFSMNIVGASDATKTLQSKADTDNYPKGREPLPSDPAKSTRSYKK